MVKKGKSKDRLKAKCKKWKRKQRQKSGRWRDCKFLTGWSKQESIKKGKVWKYKKSEKMGERKAKRQKSGRWRECKFLTGWSTPINQLDFKWPAWWGCVSFILIQFELIADYKVFTLRWDFFVNLWVDTGGGHMLLVIDDFELKIFHKHVDG